MDLKPPVRMTRRQFVTTSAVAVAAGSVTTGLAPVAQATPASQQDQATPKADRGLSRVIIDTDPGVDDAFALLLAMRSPELKIEGITPVAGNVTLDVAVANALRMVEISGRTEIPVAVGARAPLMRRLVTATNVHGENGLGGVVFPEPKTKPIAVPAAEFICQIVRKYPGEVTLIPIGPLTNIAAALRLDSDLAAMVRAIVLMGGSLSAGNITPAAEFNIYVDPEAARIVFQSGVPISMVGLDATRKTSLTEEHLRTLEAGHNPASQAAAQIGRNAIKRVREQSLLTGPHMHDSLAVAAVLDPSILTFRDYYVDIETTGELTAGETVAYNPNTGDSQRKPGTERQTMAIRGSAPTLAGNAASPVLRDKYIPNARVAVDVDSEKFFKLLIGRLSA
jgi:inosine-uridine nucleoside N-ribohydrolase